MRERQDGCFSRQSGRAIFSASPCKSRVGRPDGQVDHFEVLPVNSSMPTCAERLHSRFLCRERRRVSLESIGLALNIRRFHDPCRFGVINRSPIARYESPMRSTSARSTPVPRITRSVPAIVRLPELDSFDADQRIGDSPHILRFPFHHENLQAVVMIQVNVHRRKNVVMRFMLHVGELVAQHPDVMIVNQGDGSDHRLVGRFRGLSDQLIPYQIAEGLRAVRVAPLAMCSSNLSRRSESIATPMRLRSAHSSVDYLKQGEHPGSFAQIRQSCYREVTGLCTSLTVSFRHRFGPLWARSACRRSEAYPSHTNQ